MKILLIEDHPELAKSIVTYLTQEHYLCEVAATFDEAREKLILFTYDCVLLDIMLPDGNGINLLKLLRKDGVESSVIIISAQNALDFKLTGLSEGADDYITKPFPLPELHARIKAIMRRRSPHKNSNILTFQDLTADLDSMECRVKGKLLNLTRKETNLLLYFINNKGRMLTRQAIAAHLWGDYTDNLDSVDFVYQHVKNLRKKITDVGGQDYISTVYGLGYKLNVAE
ncbi:response regulator transcription factor [Hymenobacter puniceus]|uniref:response regulator transcription factor n=1 Tax=Hymenobacter sp. BT190 TaxID=2763505 RepID=UPI0016514692|nr:response regulator transcription factor [Hymenobacter sp. BT190]MBC6699139.1 response regulator transcription factor [Hymenobacter sp. BT190]